MAKPKDDFIPMQQVHAEQLAAAIDRFEKATAAASHRLLNATWVLVGCTICLFAATIALIVVAIVTA